jgi:outer membrane protein assembly factor BamD (BamD/ComL family)
MKFFFVLFILFMSCSWGTRANKEARQENEIHKTANYSSGISFYNKSPTNLLNDGGKELSKKNYNNAIDIYSEVVKMDDADDDEKSDALLRIGSIYNNFFYPKKDAAKATLYFNKIINMYPKTEHAVSAKLLLETLKE